MMLQMMRDVAVDCCVVQWCKHIYATEASIKKMQEAVRVEVDAIAAEWSRALSSIAACCSVFT